jgi:hypothetical protein
MYEQDLELMSDIDSVRCEKLWTYPDFPLAMGHQFRTSCEPQKLSRPQSITLSIMITFFLTNKSLSYRDMVWMTAATEVTL